MKAFLYACLMNVVSVSSFLDLPLRISWSLSIYEAFLTASIVELYEFAKAMSLARVFSFALLMEAFI